MTRFWSGYSTDGLWWFRIFGVGFSGQDITKHRLLFSQRYGYKKAITLGKWRFEYLEKSLI